MGNFTINTWVKILLFNLMTVALMGVLMRYKIRFEFPFLDQQNIQHAHSHFAFTGWITQSLLVLIASLIKSQLTPIQLRRYNLLLWCNLICAYGLLISFFINGYGLFAIIFSTLSVVLLVVFSRLILAGPAHFIECPQAHNWIKGALFFAILSSIGTIVLAYMMMSKNIWQNLYLASVYFYLHFQYNGWFFFACAGLFVGQANKHSLSVKGNRLTFHLLFWSCIPAYFLSTLWAHIPVWLYVITVIAAITQLAAWLILLRNAFSYRKEITLSGICRFLFLFVAIAGTIKYMLQCASTIPDISHLAFGFRPIVIAYLHLVLLALISVMIILYMYGFNLIKNSRRSSNTIFCFAIGILFNEIALAVQGCASIIYVAIPFISSILLIVAIILFVSALCLFLVQLRKET